MTMMCSNGCDRLASLAPDTNGDLCGVCRDAEMALGREPLPVTTSAGLREIHLSCMAGHVHHGLDRSSSMGHGRR